MTDEQYTKSEEKGQTAENKVLLANVNEMKACMFCVSFFPATPHEGFSEVPPSCLPLLPLLVAQLLRGAWSDMNKRLEMSAEWKCTCCEARKGVSVLVAKCW